MVTVRLTTIPSKKVLEYKRSKSKSPKKIILQWQKHEELMEEALWLRLLAKEKKGSITVKKCTSIKVWLYEHVFYDFITVKS